MEEEAEESKWQDRINSGFDRLVAFASTELDKRRRSTEGNESCNTSPDSGIGHGDPPPLTITLPPNKQSIKLNPKTKPAIFKIPANKNKNLSNSPITDQSNDETGPPRTPSPSSPPSLPVSYSPEFPIIQDKSPNPALLKYQRHTEERKSKPDQHFKKKFYYREQWRDDWQKQNDDPIEPVRDKFKPKGKDWNWQKDHHPEFVQGQIINCDWNQSHDKFGNWKN